MKKTEIYYFIILSHQFPKRFNKLNPDEPSSSIKIIDNMILYKVV